MISSILLLLIYVILCWFLMVFIHELSHLMFGFLFNGIKPLGLYPIFHWGTSREPWRWRIWRPWELTKQPDGFDVFYFASYRYLGTLQKTPGGIVHIAPLVVSSTLLMILSLLYFLHISNIVTILLMVCASVDSIVWFKGYFWGNEYTDWFKYRYGLK